MALRTYGSDTLNDNWAEERSKALRGVLSDFGHREYETTHKTAFSAPRTGSRGSSSQTGWSNAFWKQRRVDPVANPGLLNMTHACTMQQAMRDRPVDDRAFGSLVGRTRPIASLVNRAPEAETTTRAAFGVPKRACRTGHRGLHVPEAPPGGRVESRTEMEDASPDDRSAIQRKGGYRPVGERFMQGEEPAQSTEAQRSWVYSHDPVVKYHDEGVPLAHPPKGLSLDVGEGPRAATANNKRSRSITLEREPATEKGTSVWIDWHIAPGEA
ncbi:unnamed protein product [Ectocarpus sp. 12 AP-2014]